MQTWVAVAAKLMAMTLMAKWSPSLVLSEMLSCMLDSVAMQDHRQEQWKGAPDEELSN